jgi:uncharacterized membrane protein YdjX (TVP38/TMEM64 family)
MNVENNIVEGLYMAITCIVFFVFVLNFIVINSIFKLINVSCDEYVVNLLYIIIVPFCAYTFMFEYFLGSMKEIILMFVDWNVFHWDIIYKMLSYCNQGRHHFCVTIRI